MKIYARASWAALLTIMLLFAGCSKPAAISDAEKAAAARDSQPAISAPAESTPSPVPAPAPPSTAAQPKAKPAPKAAVAPKAAPVPEQDVSRQASVQPQVEPAPPVAKRTPGPPAPIFLSVTLPAGTQIPIRTIDSVDSRTDQVGQTFNASIDSDVSQGDQVVIPKGADVRLKLTRVTSAGEIRGKSELQLQLDRITVGQKGYVVVSDVVERVAAAEGPKTARDIGIGAAVGAAIGAITGGKKGAAIGAGVGAGSGAVVAAITKGEQVLVPSETRLEFRLEQPVDIEVRYPSSS